MLPRLPKTPLAYAQAVGVSTQDVPAKWVLPTITLMEIVEHFVPNLKKKTMLDILACILDQDPLQRRHYGMQAWLVNCERSGYKKP